MKRAVWILVFALVSPSVFAAPKQKQESRSQVVKAQPVKPMMWAGDCYGNACSHCNVVVREDNSIDYTCAWDGSFGGCGCFLNAQSGCVERGNCHLTQ